MDFSAAKGSTLDCDGNCNFLHLNVRSLPKNISDVKQMLEYLSDHDIRISALMLCETFLNVNSKKLINIPHYNMFSVERPDQMGGGIAIFVHESIRVKKTIMSEITDSVEILVLETEINDKTFVIGEFYRKPNTNPTDLINYLTTSVLPKICKYDSVFIGCDQNVDYLTTKKFIAADDLFTIMINNNLIPTINLPTRVTHESATLIDNIYVKTNCKKLKSYVLVDNISDHYPCLVNVNYKWNSVRDEVFSYRKYTTDGFEKLNHDLLHTNWNFLDTCPDVDIAYNRFVKILQDCLNEHIPLKTDCSSNQVESYREPWMCVKLDKYNRKCKRLFKKQKLNPTPANIKRYRDYNVTLKKLKRFEKNNFYKTKFEKVKNDSRSIWNILKSLCNKRRNKLDIPYILVNNRKEGCPGKIANLLSDHFSTAGVNVQKQIPNSNGSVGDLISKCNVKLSNISTSDIEVERIIKDLKDKKSYGLDGISNLVLKNIAVSIRSPLSKICNMSLSTGVVPSNMKIAKIIPLFKGGEVTTCENYRPISLLPVLSKILEKIVFKRMVAHMDENNILYAKQFGFRSGHSDK